MDRLIKAYFDSFRKAGKLPPELAELGKRIRLFDDEELLKVWRSNLRGIRWEDKEGNIIRGSVDEILKKGRKLIVLDYKTRGYPLKEDSAVYYQDQLDIYNFLLRKNGYKTEDYAYLLFYHPTKINKRGNVKFQTDIVKMKISVKNAERIFKEALRVLKGDIPEAGEYCEFCEWTQFYRMETEGLDEKINKAKWKKTEYIRQHEYVLKKDYPELFLSLVKMIDIWGYGAKFKNKKYRYLDIEEYKYWYDKDVLNRELK